MAYCIGLDLHQQYSVLVVKEQTGRLVTRGKVPNDVEALRTFLAPWQGQCITVALEATSNYYWMYETLERLGCTVHLAHPLKVKAIASARIKTDAIDANVLCDLLRGDLLPTSYIPPAPIRELRELVRHRMRLVHDRTVLKNRCQAVVTKLNLHNPWRDAFGNAGRRWFQALTLPPVFQLQCAQLLTQIDAVTTRIQVVDRRIRVRAAAVPAARQLMTIRGLGPFSSLVMVAEIGDIHRFPSPKQLVSYAGLAPGVYASGQVTAAALRIKGVATCGGCSVKPSSIWCGRQAPCKPRTRSCDGPKVTAKPRWPVPASSWLGCLSCCGMMSPLHRCAGAH